MFIYWQFLAVSLGETVFNATPEQGGPAWDEAIAWSGLQNAAYNFVTMVSALFLVGFAQRIGAKRVHAVALGLAAVALIWLAHIHNQYLALVPMIGLGIFWASAVGVPYLMVASMVPAKRTGVYMGILNMMIVVPMLIETVTFGWIFNHLLDSKGSNAITLAGVLMAIGARGDAVGEPARRGGRVADRAARAATRSITVYDRVVVGSDGTPDQPVRRGPGRGGGAGRPGQAGRRHGVPRRRPEHGADARPKGCTATSTGPRPPARPWRSRSPVSPGSESRYIEQRLVRGRPGAGASRHGRRRTRRTSSSSATVGWAPSEGQLLGSVPARGREERRLRRTHRADHPARR